MDSTAHSDLEIISLRQIGLFFWRWKWVMLVTILTFAIGSTIWVNRLPNEYQANILVVPNGAESSSGLAGLAGQFGGLASLAGVSLGAEQGGDSAVALSLMESRQFVMKFIDKYDLLPALIAAKNWDAKSNQLVFDEDLYDGKNAQWNKKTFLTPESHPTAWVGYGAFLSRLDIQTDRDSGVVDIHFEHYSPQVATDVVKNIVREINEQMRISAIKEAEKSILYLHSEVEKTPVTELQAVFYSLIEEQTKNLMLAKVREDYIFRVIAEPVLPEYRYGPQRLFLVIVVTLIGGLFSILLSLLIDAFWYKK